MLCVEVAAKSLAADCSAATAAAISSRNRSVTAATACVEFAAKS